MLLCATRVWRAEQPTRGPDSKSKEKIWRSYHPLLQLVVKMTYLIKKLKKRLSRFSWDKRHFAVKPSLFCVSQKSLEHTVPNTVQWNGFRKKKKKKSLSWSFNFTSGQSTKHVYTKQVWGDFVLLESGSEGYIQETVYSPLGLECFAR